MFFAVVQILVFVVCRRLLVELVALYWQMLLVRKTWLKLEKHADNGMSAY